MSTIKSLTELVRTFRDERDWRQFHNPKDCAISLSLEAAEVLEHFQWKTPEEIDQYLETHKEEVADELADVLNWVLLMSHDFDIDIADAFQKKLKKNEEKYPAEKWKGRKGKYTDIS